MASSRAIAKFQAQFVAAGFCTLLERAHLEMGIGVTESNREDPRVEARKQGANEVLEIPGGSDGTRTRDLRRDRPTL
jgi:hypothetical protein